MVPEQDEIANFHFYSTEKYIINAQNHFQTGENGAKRIGMKLWPRVIIAGDIVITVALEWRKVNISIPLGDIRWPICFITIAFISNNELDNILTTILWLFLWNLKALEMRTKSFWRFKQVWKIKPIFIYCKPCNYKPKAEFERND